MFVKQALLKELAKKLNQILRYLEAPFSIQTVEASSQTKSRLETNRPAYLDKIRIRREQIRYVLRAEI